MEEEVHQQAGLAPIEMQIAELARGLQALEEVVVAMSADGGDTGEQAALVLKILRMRRTLAMFRRELKQHAPDRRDDSEAS